MRQLGRYTRMMEGMPAVSTEPDTIMTDATYLHVDLAIFAHNEVGQIGQLIVDLAEQDIFAYENVDLRILILANGCTDGTVPETHAAIDALPPAIAAHFEVMDLPQGGKSRTGHRFIHEFARPSTHVLGFMDADIRLPRPDTLRLMARAMAERPELHVFTSRPVKDVVFHKVQTGPAGRLIATGGGGLTDWRKSICGQLFFLRASTALRIGLPAGLPVEDGFFRAMILTDLLSTTTEDLSRIDGDPEVFHIYESIQSIGELLRHQTRIVIGSAVNSALYGKIRREAPTEPQAHDLLMQAADDEGWLARTLSEELPRRPYGYVPGDFLTKRWTRWRSSGKPGLKSLLMLLVGLSLDAVVWLKATWKMHRGIGAGHW